MHKIGVVLVAALVGTVGLMTANAFNVIPAATADLGGDQADSVNFQLWFAPDTDELGHVVYCGVTQAAEPYILDAAVTHPQTTLEDPEPPSLPRHERAGWLMVWLQGKSVAPAGVIEYSVPPNSSYSFSLTLGGIPNVDQMVHISSKPAGDEFGSGAAFSGIASVRAQSGATDPFIGDGRDDNFCVSIGIRGEVSGAEFFEGRISTALSVPDEWVIDGNGADGGVLRGFPH